MGLQYLNLTRLGVSAALLPRLRAFSSLATVKPVLSYAGMPLHRVDGDGSERPLAVVCGWLSSTERQLKPYLRWYHERGIDTLSFSVGPGHVLQPDTALEHMRRVLDATLEAKAPQVVMHFFSVGGFLCGQGLRVVARNREKYFPLEEKIIAQIYDSPPDFRGIPAGISSHMYPENTLASNTLRNVVKSGLNGFLSATKNGIGVEHRASSKAFHDNLIKAPALWFYSQSDPIAAAEDCETVIQKWRKNGKVVEECVWDVSPHIQHGRLDPTRYFSTLEQFLLDQDVILKQKDKEHVVGSQFNKNEEEPPRIYVE